MKAVSIDVKQLYQSGRRLDASYHASDGVKALHFIRQWAKQPDQSGVPTLGRTRERRRIEYGTYRLDPLEEVCVPGGIFIPGRFKRYYVDDPEHGEPWLSPSDMLKADLSGLRLVSSKLTPAIETLRVCQDWILLSRSGTIGNLAYVREDMAGMVGSDDIIRIVSDPAKILPGYLYTYLSSPLGKALIEQNTYGAVVPHIEAHHIIDLPVPRLEPSTEQRIHELIEQAAALWASAQESIVQSQAPFSYLLTDEVRQYFPHDRDCGIVKLSELQDRLGGHYHSAIYRRLEARVREGNFNELEQLSLRIFAPPPFKHIYLPQPNQYPFITGGQLTNHRFTDVKYLSKYGVKQISDYVVHEGWLAIYKSGQLDSMLGTTFYLSRQLEGFCLSDHVIRVVIDDQAIHPAYVFAFLSTWAGRLLIIRRAMGKSVPFVREETVSTIPIPILSAAEQHRVARLVNKAVAMRLDSLKMEENAQRLLAEALE